VYPDFQVAVFFFHGDGRVLDDVLMPVKCFKDLRQEFLGGAAVDVDNKKSVVRFAVGLVRRGAGNRY
jgi:hypothetical protein